MTRQGYRKDKGGKFTHVDKPLRFQGASWIEPMGSISMFEDFIGDKIEEGSDYVVNQAGTATTTVGIGTAAGGTKYLGHGGWLAGAVDNVDAEIDEVALGAKPWMRSVNAGNGMLVAEIGFVIPTALTARQYYIGLGDDEAEGTATNGPLNIQSAYTLVDVNDNAAGFIFSSLATAPTIYKYASTLATVGSTVSAATEGVTGVVDEYTVCRVEVDVAGNAFFYQSISGGVALPRKDPEYIGSTVTAVTPTVLLLPIFTAAASTTTAVEWEIDYMFGACAR